MKNRAKCKLCNDIIESFHSTDCVMCKCGEIGVDGGDKLLCFANDFSNFLRVDDKGNEIVVKVENNSEPKDMILNTKPTKKDLLEMLDNFITNIDQLPQHAKYSPVSHADLSSVLTLVSSILRSP